MDAMMPRFFLGFPLDLFCVALIHGCSWDKSMDMVGRYILWQG